MKKILLLFVSVILIIFGIITFPLPIPTGILLMVMGVALLVSSSTRAANRVKRYRKENPDLHNGIIHLENFVPTFIKEALRKTHPD